MGYNVKAACTRALYFLSFTLHGVLYIPSFHYNLISISMLILHLEFLVLFTKLAYIIEAPSIKRLMVVISKLQDELHKHLYSTPNVSDPSHSCSLYSFLVDIVADSYVSTLSLSTKKTLGLHVIFHQFVDFPSSLCEFSSSFSITFTYNATSNMNKLEIL